MYLPDQGLFHQKLQLALALAIDAVEIGAMSLWRWANRVSFQLDLNFLDLDYTIVAYTQILVL